ncbi:unnamed protein product [marine sediment metagenome]|uniref:Uncharacterized protein n=1 Tax=marine sediment metagenome TaxID=412755 RepID=X1CKX3_9ZZZZ
MQKDSTLIRESGRKRKITGRTVIGVGVLFFLYGIVAACLMTPGYREMAEAYWDTLDPAGLTMARIWGISMPLGIILTFIGSSLVANVKAGLIWILTAGGLAILALIIISPFPSTSSIFFGISGSLIIFLWLGIVIIWGKRRLSLTDKEVATTDLKMLGYMFFALATWFICGLSTMHTFLFYPDEIAYLQIQENAIGVIYLVMSFLILGWFFTFLGQYLSKKVNKNN